MGEKIIKDKSNTFDATNNHFCIIGEVLKPELPDWGDRYKECLPTRMMNSFFIEPVCNDDVELEIDTRIQRKQQVLTALLVNYSCVLIFFSNKLTKIYKQAIQSGAYPHAMEFAQAIFLYKKMQGMIPIIITRLASPQFSIKYLKTKYV